MTTFSEALYFLHVEIMTNLAHFNSIDLENLFPSINLEKKKHWNHADDNMVCPTLKPLLNMTEGQGVVVKGVV